MKQREMAAPKERIADILTGRSSDSAAKALSTYGIMSNEQPSRVLGLSEYLISEGYITQSENGCDITPLADEFIRARRTLLMKQPKSSVITSAPSKTVESDLDAELYERLKALRKKIAATLGVPAYVVFTDASLREICQKQPLTTQEFMNISGVGSIKAERYSKKFAEVILEYRKEKGI